MKPKSLSCQKQAHLFYQDLLEPLNPKDLLLLLAGKLPWEMFKRASALRYTRSADARQSQSG